MGKALNLKNRVSSYFVNKDLGEKTKALVSQVVSIETIEVTSEIESFLLEERLIKKHKPKYNIRLVDGKTYILLKITTKDEYPKVLLTRKEIDDGSLYFGPFTSTNSLKIVLKIIRRIFPFESANHQGRICLYNHLGLCTCPSVTKDTSYSKTIRYIIDFLNGKTEKVIKGLTKERNVLSKLENYEKASQMQKKIDAITLVTSPFYKPFEYLENPNLRSDVVKNELAAFRHVLNSHGLNVKNVKRVECYDISNISGMSATGSMVVFTNGEKDGNSYRRFKIKGFYKNKPNDFAMMEEVLTRRFSHKDWPIPSLVIVDGGKGQVSSASKVLKSLNLSYPLLGLAKKEEILITENFEEIKLSKSSESLKFVMRIRDEAHRFAITYHRKLRSKLTFE